MNNWDRIDQFIGRIEKILLAVMLGLMVLMAFSQIVLRNFFATGIPWGDSLVRYLVLWVGFIGAAGLTAGAFMMMQEAGLEMPDIDDFKSIGGGDEPPPPPPQ